MANTKKPAKRKGRFTPAVAAATGLIVGAGMAIAGAVALKDKKSRDKVKRALVSAKNQAAEYMKKMKKKAKSKK